VLRFQASSGRFVRDTAFDKVVDTNLIMLSSTGGFLFSDPRGACVSELRARHRHDGAEARRIVVGRSRSLRAVREPAVGGVFPDGDVVWMQFTDGRLVRYDTSQKSETPAAGQVLIRRITGSRERSLYTGDTVMPVKTELDAKSNSLHFEYALPAFVEESLTEYQSRLDGFDTDWSPWTREHQRDYTNLGFGNYHFRVRARSVIGTVSGEASYAFTILRLGTARGWRTAATSCSACWSSALSRA
jgi:hypothetical protein